MAERLTEEPKTEKPGAAIIVAEGPKSAISQAVAIGDINTIGNINSGDEIDPVWVVDLKHYKPNKSDFWGD
jgi:hypothetical protein